MIVTATIVIKAFAFMLNLNSKCKDQRGIPLLEKDNKTITDSFCKAIIL